ncbi:MAG: serine hydrolase domain-containing protein [Nannocystales bacterium]
MSARPLVLILAVAASACAGESRPPSPAAAPVEEPAAFTLPDDFAQSLSTYVAGWGKQWPTFRVHGTTAVFAEGETLYQQSWGLRDLAQETAHGEDDAFEIGTLSVHLTHVAVLDLVRSGDLALDDAVATHIPDLGLQPSITVEHLLTMTSGLPNFTETMLFERVYKRRAATHKALVTSFAGDPLEFDPGTDFAPSLSNAALLGLLLEEVTEQPYADVVQTRVLGPLGMEHTKFGRQPGASVGLSFHPDEHLEPVVEATPASLGAAGGWTSTATDLGKLYAALLNETYGAELSRRMFGNNDLDKPYGFAPTTIAGRDAYGWVGLFDGHEHGVLLIPSDGLVVIHLANSEVAPGSQIAEAVAQMAYEFPVPVRDEARPVPLDPEPFAAFAGQWVMTPSDLRHVELTADAETLSTLRVVDTEFVQGEGLRLHIQGRQSRRMHPTAPRKFFFKDRPQSTAYITTTAASTMLVLERGGGSLHYRRVAAQR